MGVKTSEEVLWLALMLRWEKAGVQDGTYGMLDGKCWQPTSGSRHQHPDWSAT